MLDFLKNVSPIEIGVVVFVLFLLFGRKVVVGIARSAGETLSELRNIKTNMSEVVDETGKTFKAERASNV